MTRDHNISQNTKYKFLKTSRWNVGLKPNPRLLGIIQTFTHFHFTGEKENLMKTPEDKVTSLECMGRVKKNDYFC